MSITLSDAAVKHISKHLASRERSLGIRLGVKTTGCSGLAYVLEFVDAPDIDDNVFEDHGVKIFIDPKSLVYLDGTVVNFVKEGLNEGFEFTNPNVTGQCGCGESFQV